jgi:hypothetical protein
MINQIKMLISSMFLLLVWGGTQVSCTQNEPYKPRSTEGVLSIFLNPVRLDELLPGGYFKITGQGLIEDATYQVSLDLNQATTITRIPLEMIEILDGLLVRWPVQEGLNIPEGSALGSILVEASLRNFTGIARAEWSAQLAHTLTPQLSGLSPLLSPQTPSSLSGSGLLHEGEGTSILNLNGQFIDHQGMSTSLEISEPLTDQLSAQTQDALSRDRSQRWWSPHPRYFGIKGGRFEGSANITNNGVGGLTMSETISVSFEVSEPYISLVTPSSVSRGQRLFIEGGGFVDLLDSSVVGLTTLSFTGTLTPFNTAQSPVEYTDLRFEVRHETGAKISTSFEPGYNSSCESLDLGGMAGVLEGEFIATVFWSDQEVTTNSMPMSIEIASSKQVVYLSFLPAFTDSLRLFGLRNLSARVIDEIIAVVQRDYTGVNLEIRTTPPTDFELYSTVEIGGPDPNAQSLFGLDNTTGLDVCNQRLDDNLAGRNAESGNSYGGVFVESFLNLSPAQTSDANSLADPIFDEIFQPLMMTPAQLNDLQGPRAESVLNAIRVLGHLVGNTLTHEIGHSLGLPVIAGCGSYHNAPGPRQIMDCGRDRPFIERAGLDPEGPPRWTSENFSYLQKILPQ